MIRFRRAPAFSLLELLFVIGIIAILASISMALYSTTTRKGDQVRCLNNMHQVGIAINLYVGEHDGTYPGPLESGQKIYYDAKMLSGFIFPYLGAGNTLPKAGTVAPMFVCPAWSKVVPKPKSGDNVICYVLNRSFSGVDVFGYPGQSDPMKAALIAGMSNVAITSGSGAASKTFSIANSMLMTDVDQVNWAYDKTAGWYSALPKQPVHPGGRNSLFYDMHASVRPLTSIP